MIGLGTASLKIYVALEPQDMRKSFNGLSELALVHLGGRLDRDALFVFTNRTAHAHQAALLRRERALGRDEATREGRVQLAGSEQHRPEETQARPRGLALLLDGVDMRGGKFRPWYERD